MMKSEEKATFILTREQESQVQETSAKTLYFLEGDSQQTQNQEEIKREKMLKIAKNFYFLTMIFCVFLLGFSLFLVLSSLVSPAAFHQSDATINPPFNQSDATINPPFNQSSKAINVLAWSNCNPSADTCISGYTCCVGPADANTSPLKYTCRTANAVGQSYGCLASTPPPPTSSTIADWSTCPNPTTDKCASTGFVCCVAPADLGKKTGVNGQDKQTCRPSNQCASTSTPPPPSTTVAAYSNCNPSTSVCVSGYTCCVGPADVGTNKYTCRTANALGQSYGCSSSGLSYTSNNLPVANLGQSCGASAGKQCGSQACCSEKGTCGTSQGFCSLGCQSQYGACNAQKPPAAPAVDYSKTAPAFYTCTRPGLIALTFDDGHYSFTQQLLDILKAKAVNASFFYNGFNLADITVAPYPDLMKRAYNEGHYIGSHTYNHKDLTKSTVQQAYEQLYQNDLVMKSILGFSSKYPRPPFGFYNKTVESWFNSWGYKGIAMYNADSRDFEQYKDADFMTKQKNFYISKLQNADPTKESFVFLHHEVLKATVEQVVPWVLDYVPSLKKGWRFVTFHECIGVTDPYK